MPIDDLEALQGAAATAYPELAGAAATRAHAFVHDVVRFDRGGEAFALKIYRHGLRSAADVAWEAALTRHLRGAGAPVAELVPALDGPVASVVVDGVRRHAMLTRWLPGGKPRASTETYHALGVAAATIHGAADTFDVGTDRRAPTTIETLLHEPLELLHGPLERQGAWAAAEAVAAALGERVASATLDRGICHNDLTLDNVHMRLGRIEVFDFDSAAVCWRAMEPAGVWTTWHGREPDFWHAWLEGYREHRSFSPDDEAAVPLFAIVGEILNTAWKLGLTAASVGALVEEASLPATVAGWQRAAGGV